MLARSSQDGRGWFTSSHPCEITMQYLQDYTLQDKIKFPYGYMQYAQFAIIQVI